MLKRIFTIALFTGAGQFFVVFALKYISQHSSTEQIKAIAQIDSLILFMMNAIALGLQSSAMRNLALTKEWKPEYAATQSARIMLGFLLTVLMIFAFTNKYYMAFLIAPLLAWSGDYALYAKGHSIAGSIIAFTRAIFPFSMLMLFTIYLPDSLVWVYLAALAIVYIFTNLIIAGILKVSFFQLPLLKNLKLYIKTLPLGVVALCLYFVGMGVILVAPYFYSDSIIATAFIGLKFYVIFKGVLRIIHQAFLREMTSDEICFKVDKLSSLLGLTFAAFIICFPNTFIRLFFGEKYLQDRSYFMLLGISALVYSLFFSFTTRAILDKKDNQYAKTSLIAAILTLVTCIILSFAWQQPYSIGISILAGEIFFSIGMLYMMNRKELLVERLLFLLRNIIFLLIPVTAIIWGNDKEITFFPALLLFASFLFVLYRNKFGFPADIQS